MTTYSAADLSVSFNKNIKKCLQIASMALDSSSGAEYVIFDTVRRRIQLVVNADPFFLLENAGAYIFKYRDVIHSDNLDDMIMNPEAHLRSDDKQELEQTASDHSSELDSFKSLLNCLKAQWEEYTEKERKTVRKIIKALLSDYCKWLTTQTR